MEFEEWLDNKLDKPAPDWFDYDGNSSRATVLRMRKGVLTAIKYEHKHYLKNLRSWLSDFDGFRTEIGWFVQIPIVPIYILIGGFVMTYLNYRSAIDEYKWEYEIYLKRNKEE